MTRTTNENGPRQEVAGRGCCRDLDDRSGGLRCAARQVGEIAAHLYIWYLGGGAIRFLRVSAGFPGWTPESGRFGTDPARVGDGLIRLSAGLDNDIGRGWPAMRDWLDEVPGAAFRGRRSPVAAAIQAR